MGTGYQDTVRGTLTVSAAADLMRLGALSPSALTEHCITQIDRYEPDIRAWAYLDRDRARVDADRLTAELESGFDRGPLHGIPVGIKDIVDVVDMPTGCGSAVWKDSYARRDAECVERLRQAGAVVLGKTVTTPFAYLDPPPTRNPWLRDRTPGGSSSGSAAAVAAGMCLAAVASQTGGSTIRPAAYCGVAAIKPTYGRISTVGVLPLAPSLDHIGLMTADVRGLATVLQGVADHRLGETPAPDDYSQFLAPSPTQKVVGFLSGLADKLGREERAEFRTILTILEEDGWTIRPVPVPIDWPDYWRSYSRVIAAEAAAFHAERLARRPTDYPTEIHDLVVRGHKAPATEYLEAVAHMRRVRDGGRDQMFARGVRVLVCPAATGVAPSAETTGDPKMNIPWSFAGLPAVTLPVGWNADGLPLGIQLVGLPFQEAELLGVAAGIERAVDFHRRPVPG
jgi:Asp-tRNA(Asn)/Glu-tRNA(Gln) amidotransferase A subunit family amidase